jgi:UDP-2,3-diacylglucosamine hydrolase
MNSKKIFFLSDFHLGAPNAILSRAREKKIISFLDSIEDEASEIFLLGDMFDFWFEYKQVVPKGYVRLLGKLAAITDSGIPVHFFVGNHDMWMKDYFQKELNIKVYHEPAQFNLGGKDFFIGHGDGLGPGDHGYKCLKKIFRNPICQTAFGILPSNIGISLANYFSRKSRAKTGIADEVFESEEKEFLVAFCKDELTKKHFDYFVFGHRHLPLNINVGEKSTYINLGDWITHFTYAEFDGDSLDLKSYNGE